MKRLPAPNVEISNLEILYFNNNIKIEIHNVQNQI